MPLTTRRPYLNGLGLDGARDHSDWASEKEPPHLHAVPSRGPASIAENAAFSGSACIECNESACVCQCYGCEAKGWDVVRGECGVCREYHAQVVAREQRESIEQVAWMCAQQAMEAI